MKILIAEDDVTSRKVLETLLAPYGECDVASDGKEALEAFKQTFDSGKRYALVCLDIMMPNMDGQEVLKAIRKYEHENGVEVMDGTKVIMTTALDDASNVLGAFKTGCEAYVVKPVEKEKLDSELKKLGFQANHNNRH